VYTIVELVNLQQFRAESAGGAAPRAGSGRPAAGSTAGGAPAAEPRFGDVGPAPEVTLDRRTRNDPYLAQLKRRATDQ
jgi:hypothetical protein